MESTREHVLRSAPPGAHPQDAGRPAAAFCCRYCCSAYFSFQAAGTAAPARLSRTSSCLRSSPASPGLHQEQHCHVRPSAHCSPPCRFSTCRRCNRLPGQVQGTGPLKAHGRQEPPRGRLSAWAFGTGEWLCFEEARGCLFCRVLAVDCPFHSCGFSPFCLLRNCRCSRV